MATKDMQTLEQSYDSITALYDLADEVIQTVLQSPKEQQEEHFQLVNPIAEEIETSADTLTEEFINVAEGKGEENRNMPRTGRIEMAFRRIYAAIDEYTQELQARGTESVKAIAQTVNPLVRQVKRHLEKVVAIFMRMVDLSLERIMQKADIEALKQHNTKVANILHEMSASPGKSI